MTQERPQPSIRSFRELRDHVRGDYAANKRDFWSPGFQALAIYRFGVWGKGLRARPARVAVRVIHRFLNFFIRNFYGIELYPLTYVGHRLAIIHQHGIIIHPKAVIGDDCLIRQGVSIGAAKPGGQGIRPPVIGNRVEIGAGAALVGQIVVGDDVVIGPNAVVMTNVPAGSIVAAPQARILTPPPRRKLEPPADAGPSVEVPEAVS
jgi:serine O-acetyltransferase